MDNPDECMGKRVLDVGSGSGASAIASKLSGAAHVIANDTDNGMFSVMAIFVEHTFQRKPFQP